MHDRQQHDFAHAVAWRVVELFRPLLRGEEAREAYAEAYEIAIQEIRNYLAAAARQEQRLRPTGE
jgi:hypothetical protein